MSTSQFPINNGKTKKGNGVDYLMHQEREALKKNLMDLKSSMSTRDNLFYTKMRDDIEAKYKRLNNVKTREVEAQNEKMYGKLLSILDNEKRSITKHRAYLGPISLNVGVRRRNINTINNENEVISKKLNEIKCLIPTKEKLDKDFAKVEGYRRACSIRKADGFAKLDPLFSKRKQFELATSDFSQNYEPLSMKTPHGIKGAYPG